MTSTSVATAPSRGKRWLVVAQRAFLLIALTAIATYLARHAGELSNLLTAPVLYRCLVCAVIFAALHPLIGCAFFLLQRHMSIEIRLRTSLSAYMRRIPARYIPGGIWHSAARYADLKFDRGVGGATLRQLFLMEVILVATTGLIASGAGIWILPADIRAHWVSELQATVGLLVLLALIVWRSRHATVSRLAAAAGILVTTWTASAFGFALVADAAVTAAPGPGCGPDVLAAAYMIAAIQGYVAIFAPQGWGITEASFTVLSPCGAPLSAILSVFVLFRISGMLGDIFGYGAWSLFFGNEGSPGP